mgnify:CR=1 FL=1
MNDYMKRMDLQLFATQTTTLSDSGNSLNAEMKTFYDMRLIDEAGPALVHDQFGQKRPIPKNGGKTIEFRKFTPLAKVTGNLTEGVTPSGDKLDVTAKTSTVKQYGNFIVMSDVLELTALDNVLLETVKLMGQNRFRPSILTLSSTASLSLAKATRPGQTFSPRL